MTDSQAWEAITGSPLGEAWRPHADWEDDWRGEPRLVLVCGHHHQTKEAAERCSEQMTRNVSGPNNTELSCASVRRVGERIDW